MVTDGDNPANPFASLSAYERRHLVTHLILAGELATAHRLLAVETAQQRNGWHQIKEAHGEVASFVADVNRIWREAEKAVQLQIAEGAWEFALGWPLRYALIASSINSLALNIPPGLMTTAVARGIWPAATALAYIRQMPDARQQLETTLKLLPDLPAESLLDAFSLVRDLFSGADQIRGLAALAPHLPAAREEALVQIGTLADASSRAELTALLVQHLAAAGQLPEALSLLERLGGSHQTAGTLLQIAPQLAALDVAEQRRVLDLVRAMRSSVDQAAALVAILPFLATELRPVVRELAQKMKSRPAKIETLAALAELAAADQVSELMAQALSEVGEVGDGQERARLLALLSPHLSATQGKAVVTAASELGDPEARALAFAALASFLTRDQIEQSLQGLSEKSPTRTSWALRRLAPYAGGPEQERLLDMAKSLENRSIRGPLLMELAGLFSGRQRTQLEKAGLDAVTELRKPQQRAKTLAGVLPFLPEPLWDEAVAVVQRMQNDEGRALALAALAAQAPERFVDTLRETAGLIRSFAERAQALDSLAPRLSDSQVAETLANVLAIKDSEEQAWLLVSLAPFVPEAGRRRALERVSRVSADRARAQMLAQLVAYLPQEDLQRVFDLASGIKSEYSRARVLIAWAERAAPQGTRGLEEAAAQLEYDYGRALLLAATAQYVTGRQRENLVRKALRAAEAVWWLEDKVSLLAEMADYISPARLARLLTAEAEKTVSPRPRFRPPWFGEDDEQEMNSGLDMEAHSRDRGLSAAALQLARWEMPAEALKAARAIISNHERAEALVSLLPFLAPSEVPRVVDDALQVITEIARSKEVLIYRGSDDVMERWMGPTALAWLIPHASVQQEPQIAALIQLLTETWVPGAFSGYDIVFGDGVTTTRNLLELDQERLGWVRQRLLEAQARLAVRKADAERERALQDVLAQVLNLGQDPVRTLAIYNIAEFLPPTLLSMAVDIILEFDSDYWAAEALGAFVSLVDDESILNLVELATRFPAAEARDTLLAVAASQLCERRAPEPALDVAQKIESASSRYRVFSELAPLLEELPPEELIRLWQAPRPAQTLLASAASGNRQALLVQLQGLASVIHRAGGQATCEALYLALDDVSLWWP